MKHRLSKKILKKFKEKEYDIGKELGKAYIETEEERSFIGKCPKCKKGQLLKGKSAYGCTLYGKDCDFVLPFEYASKKISENQ